MKFNQLNGFVFDSESGVIGAVAGVDFIKQTITILTDDDTTVVAKLANAEFLETLGAIGGVGVINHDVVETTSGQLYELEAVGTDEVQLHLLGKKLERVETGDVIKRTDLHVLAPYVTVLGSIFQLEPAPAVEFNVIVVRKQTDDGIVFFYACNNVEREEVDLIKVVFVGHHLLKEETYQRITVSHEEYLELIESGKVVETSPQALQNYVTGLMYGQKEEAVAKCCDIEDIGDFEDEDCECYEADVEEEDFDEENETCEECGEDLEDCDCEWE